MTPSASRLFAIVAIVAIAAGLGCAGSPPGLDRPTHAPVAVSARRASFGGLIIRGTMSVTNPNPLPLMLERLDWELSIDGSPPARNQTASRTTIEPKATEIVEFGLRVPPAAAVMIGSRLAVGARSYRLTGVLHFDSAQGQLSVRFDHAGALE